MSQRLHAALVAVSWLSLRDVSLAATTLLIRFLAPAHSFDFSFQPSFTFERELKHHSGPMNDAVVTSDSKLLVSASGDKAVAISDLQTGKLVARFEGHDWVRSVDLD